MSFADRFVAEIISLQIRLYGACARLEARTDSEALHDLRIAVRRIRSLLKPIRSVEEMTALIEASAEVGRQTTSARELEVLIQELENGKLPHLAHHRRAQLNASYDAVLSGSPLKRLLETLDAWPAEFRAVELNGGWNHIQSRIRKAIKKQVDKLHQAIADKSFDRHRLRVLVKRTRYLTEAFPALSPLSSREAKLLKELQSALGKWHDYHQWCQRALDEKDLHPLGPAWTECAVLALGDAEIRLLEAAQQLPKSCKKAT